MKTHLLKLARLHRQEHELARRAKAIREKLIKANTSHTSTSAPSIFKGEYYSSTFTYADGSVCFSVDAIIYLQVEAPAGQERPKPVVHEFRFDGVEPYARLHYPPIWVGEFAPGKNLWAEAWSGKFDIPATPAPETQRAA